MLAIHQEILHLNGNRNLQGQIDTDVLSVYPKLQKLDLSFTKFQGTIPPCPSPTPDVQDKDANIARSNADTNGNSATRETRVNILTQRQSKSVFQRS